MDIPSDKNLRIGLGLRMTCLALSLTGLSGCQTLPQLAADDPTQTDRLMRTYPELRSGRFAVIADFENVSHMELVQLSSVSPQARSILDARRGRSETGRHCLAFTAGSDHDSAVLNSDRAENWFLKRDWRDYDLLMMSVFSPVPQAQLQLTLAAGPLRDRVTAQTPLQLHQGWNELSIDLADVGERLPLDDVREIKLSLLQVVKPVELLIDDIMLAAHRESIFGAAENQEGLLYAQRVGRRWRVGAGKKFELVFANGQIVGWYQLSGDPYRLHNLCEHTTLGPTPIRAALSPSGAQDFKKLGEHVAVRSQLTEMNETRIVMETTWHFVDDPAQAYANRPLHHWTYTVYATGQVFVDVQATPRSSDWNAGDMGLAISVATHDGDIVRTQSQTDGELNTPPYALVRLRATDAALLFMAQTNQKNSPGQMVEQLGANRDRTTVVYLANTGSGKIAHWSAQLFLSSSSTLNDDQVQQRASAYGRQAVTELELGHALDAGGRTTSDAWLNPSTGSIALTPAQGRVRLRMPGSPDPLFSPAFQINGPPNASAWVYVDNLLMTQVSHDDAGQLLFQLPQTVQKPTVVEVLYQQN